MEKNRKTCPLLKKRLNFADSVLFALSNELIRNKN